jgi:hypothetical protein
VTCLFPRVPCCSSCLYCSVLFRVPVLYTRSFRPGGSLLCAPQALSGGGARGMIQLLIILEVIIDIAAAIINTGTRNSTEQYRQEEQQGTRGNRHVTQGSSSTD